MVRDNDGRWQAKNGLTTISIDDYPLGEGLLITGMARIDVFPKELLSYTSATTMEEFMAALQWVAGDDFRVLKGRSDFYAVYRTNTGNWPECN